MNFYVYIYLRKDGSPYYVGKGKDNRWKRRHKVEIPPVDRVIFLIADTTEEWAHFMEMEFIDLHGRLNDGTGILENLTDGGEGMSGHIFTEEHKQKIGRARKDQTHSEETKQKISEAKKGKPGKPHTEETKRKIGEANTQMSDESKQKLRALHKGKKMSEESRRKMREAAKNRKPVTEETKRKLSEAGKGRVPWNKGKPTSEETKQKISNAKPKSNQRNTNVL